MIAQDLTLEISTEIPLSDSFLDSLLPIKTFKDYLSLETATKELSLKLQQQGYLETELKSITRDQDSILKAHYYLGNRWKEIEIRYSEEDFSKEEIATISTKATSNSFTLPIQTIESALEYLTALKAESGTPFASIRLSEISKKDNRTLTASLLLESNTRRTIDKIVIKGYEKFPTSYLTYYAGIKKNRAFSQKELIEQNELLNNLGFVTTLKSPEALFKKDSTHVYFYLEKRVNNLFDGILGFATNEETQNIEFNGYLNLELNNNLNYGEQLVVNYKADGREQQNLRVRTTLPYLFKTPLGVSLELKIFKRDSTFSTTDQQARISYQLHTKSQIYAGYKTYESSNLLEEVIAGTTVSDYNSTFFQLGANFTQAQTRSFFPIKTHIAIESEIGQREITNNTEDQWRLTTFISHIFNLNTRNSIYLKNESAILSSDTYLTNELFRFGGINSIRGFSENSIDASLFSVLNTEYRYLFSPNTYLHSIIDLGYFENQTLDQKEELYSFGIGLGLQTAAGVFKFNIANGVSASQDFKFSNTKIHISLSSRF